MTEEILPTPSPWPLYQQVKSMIIRRIESGHWKPGAKIPSENELVETLGISRMTINRAIRELTGEGHLIRKKGAGTFVNLPKPRFALFEVKSIADEITARGGRHSSEVIELKKVSGNFQLCQEMGLEKGADIFRSVLVHKDNGVPLQIAERFVNPTLVPEYLRQDFSKITPSEYLLGIVPISEVEHVIETSAADKWLKKLLAIEAGEPCLILHRTTWSGEMVVTKNRFVYAGSKFSLGGRFKVSEFGQAILI